MASDLSKLSGRNVLVVDDEELIASVIEEMLNDLGCGKVWIASNMEEAEAVLSKERPDLAVLDVHLGGDSGFQVARKFAEAGIPFLFMSGYGRHGLPEEWTTRPVIAKPFKLDILATALAALL